MSPTKYLHIVRHGKSHSDIENIRDIDRPLNKHGINDGYLMAKRILNKQILPEKIITSPAIRALHSATIFARIFNHPYKNFIICKAIYNAGTNIMIDIIKQTEDHIQSLMIFGHNPTVTNLTNHFLNEKIDSIPTTGIVGLKFKIKSWTEIDKLNPQEWFFDFPKNI